MNMNMNMNMNMKMKMTMDEFDDDEYVIEEGEEVGFFFLKDTVVTLINKQNHNQNNRNHNHNHPNPNTSESNASARKNTNTTEWMDINIDMNSVNIIKEEEEHDNDDDDDNDNDVSNDGKCHANKRKRRKLNGHDADNDDDDCADAKMSADNTSTSTSTSYGGGNGDHERGDEEGAVEEIMRNPSSSQSPSSLSLDDQEDVNLCPRCNLILQEWECDDNVNDNDNENDNDGMPMRYKYSLPLSNMENMFFNGCMNDVTCCVKHKHKKKHKNKAKAKDKDNHSRNININHAKQTKTQTQRSDAALLLGTILKCRHEGYLRIESFQILPSDEFIHEEQQQQDDDDEEEEACSTTTTSTRTRTCNPSWRKNNKRTLKHEERDTAAAAADDDDDIVTGIEIEPESDDDDDDDDDVDDDIHIDTGIEIEPESDDDDESCNASTDESLRTSVGAGTSAGAGTGTGAGAGASRPTCTYKRMQCSIVVTVSLPHLERRSKEQFCSSSSSSCSEQEKTLDGDDSGTRTRRGGGGGGGRDDIHHTRSGGQQYDEYISPMDQGLPPYGQLLFSMMRSDWTWLDDIMKSLVTIATNRQSSSNGGGGGGGGEIMRISSPSHSKSHSQTQSQSQSTSSESMSVFPQTLSLEDLYSRIRGATNPQNTAVITNAATTSQYGYGTEWIHNNNGQAQAQAQTTTVKITTGNLTPLSDDLLQCNLAPYLRAKSLHNLRCTCQYMNHVLRAVVPGMKLTLFTHQVRSLQWMRWREMNKMTDDDAIQQYGVADHTNTTTSSSSVGHALCGDVYRCVSGGSILSVMPRHRRRQRRTCRTLTTCVGTRIKEEEEEEEDCVKSQFEPESYSIIPHEKAQGTTDQDIIDDGDRKEEGPRSIGGFWHINTYTGECHLQYRTQRTRTIARCRNVARGGLLCDDPGLGKTITILSLILQSFGQSSERSKEAKKKSSVTNDTIIDSYWRENLVDFTRRQELLSLCLKLRKLDHDQAFQYPITDYDLSDDELKKYHECIEEPICLEDVQDMVKNDEYKESLLIFARDVEQIYKNAIKYNPSDSAIYRNACKLLEWFQDLNEEFRQKQLKAAISSQRRIKSSLSAIIAESKRLELQDNLISSSATLLVVPPTLVEHWEEQIKLHVDASACSKKAPLIFRHRSSTKYKRKHPYRELSDPTKAKYLCEEKGTYFPFVFIDECNDELPPKEFLSMFTIVLTTTKRLTAEWKHGSVEDELRKGKAGATKSYRSFNYDMFDEYQHSKPCPLLKVHWLRLIVDEGHTMGKKGSPTNAIEFSSWITADYRWAMTGTPTPQTTKSSLGNLFGLFKFLKHDYFSVPHWGDERCKAIDKGVKEGHFSSFFRLKHLLNLFMVRHTKKDVEQLHKPAFIMTRTNMSPSETLAYDTLVTAVQMNLIITSMEGKTSGKQDSLLHVSQGKHAKRALSNIRLACSGGTAIVPTLTYANWQETLELMRDVHNAEDIEVTRVENFLRRMTNEELSSCMCCGSQLQTLLLFPCACQICTGCMVPDTTSCLCCGAGFDVDEFQKLQPGLDYTWKWNVEEAKREEQAAARLRDALASVRNGARNQAVHNVEGIDGNGDGEEDEEETIDDLRMALGDEQIVNIVNQQQNQNRILRRQRNEPHICQYPDVYIDGKCRICSEVHLCNFMRQKECNICHCKSEDCPKEESKAYYLINKLIDLWASYRNRGVNLITGKTKRPLKVIVFSQFKQISQVVGDRLIRRFGTGCIAEYWGSGKNKELERFIRSNECFCMLLNRDGSHGLNLSFTTHIFFLDEIFDKSLESQVVARAYRMGAEEKVYVEQLVSRHSVEELIVMMNNRDRDTSSRNMLYDNSNHLVDFESDYYNEEDLIESQDVSFSSSDEKLNGPAKVRTLLSKVKLIQHNHAMKARTNARKGPRITFVDDPKEVKEKKTNNAKQVKKKGPRITFIDNSDEVKEKKTKRAKAVKFEF